MLSSCKIIQEVNGSDYVRGPDNRALLWPQHRSCFWLQLGRYKLCKLPTIYSVSKCSSGFRLGLSVIDGGSHSLVPVRDEPPQSTSKDRSQAPQPPRVQKPVFPVSVVVCAHRRFQESLYHVGTRGVYHSTPIAREESVGSVLPVTAVQLLKSQHLEAHSSTSVMNSGQFCFQTRQCISLVVRFLSLKIEKSK